MSREVLSYYVGESPHHAEILRSSKAPATRQGRRRGGVKAPRSPRRRGEVARPPLANVSAALRLLFGCGYRAALRWSPAVLAVIAGLWVVGSRGVFPSPAVVVATVAVVAALLVVELRRGVRLPSPVVWLAALVAWSAVAAATQPVDRIAAARFVAAGAVAVTLAILVARPRAAAWGRLGVLLAGAIAAVWLLAERLVGEGRPAGPFENPNIAATVMVIALAVLPLMRLHAAVRLAAAALLIAGIVGSSSRAAMIAAIAVGVVWAAATAGRTVRAVIATLASVAALGLVLRVATDRDPLRFERVRIWTVAWRTALAELPFGSGPAGFADAALAHNFPLEGGVARFHRLPSLAESDAFELLAALGLPGIVLGGGLAVATVRATARARAWTPLVAVAATSAFHTQLPLPAVAWAATLAIAGSWRRGGARGARVALAPALAAAAVAAPALVAALGAWPGGPAEAAERVAVGEAALARQERDDGALADAEAETWRGCVQRPRWAGAWSTLGGLRLRRALARNEAALALAAADAFATARRANPLDAWAALGEGRARAALGEAAAAAQALRAAVTLEPSCAPAWVELALLHLEGGELAASRGALERAEAAIASARGREVMSAYERALVAVDRTVIVRLRERLGVRR